MSSLLQFNGRVLNHGVHLQCYQTTPSQKYIDSPVWENGVQIGTERTYYLKDSETCGDTTDGIYTPEGKFYPRIWTFVRKPRGMFGCWVVFQWNGKEHVPDLSCPMGLFKLPKDAKPMSNEDCIKAWKS